LTKSQLYNTASGKLAPPARSKEQGVICHIDEGRTRKEKAVDAEDAAGARSLIFRSLGLFPLPLFGGELGCSASRSEEVDVAWVLCTILNVGVGEEIDAEVCCCKLSTAKLVAI
jgi:hypothetical protein